MKIINKSIEEIEPYSFNNKLHTNSHIEEIAESIKLFGFNQPIVVDENNVILVGHGRYFAAQKLALEKIPVLQLSGLTKENKKAYRMVDNKLSAQPLWNFENIKLELEELAEVNFDLNLWNLKDLIPQSPTLDVQELSINEPVIFEDSFMIRINCSTIEQKRSLQTLFGLSNKEKTIAYDNFMQLWNESE